MAIEVLRYPAFTERAPWHDLESFLYVLIILCASYSGPSNEPRRGFDVHNSPLGPWLIGDGKYKAEVMCRYGGEGGGGGRRAEGGDRGLGGRGRRADRGGCGGLERFVVSIRAPCAVSCKLCVRRYPALCLCEYQYICIRYFRCFRLSTLSTWMH